MNAREECYERIKKVMKDALRAYYGDHPDRLFDDRGTDAVDWSLRGLDGIYKILDDYKIEEKTKDPAGSSSGS